VIKFVSDLWQVDGFLRVLYQKADRHDISDILLNVALNIITLTPIEKDNYITSNLITRAR